MKGEFLPDSLRVGVTLGFTVVVGGLPALLGSLSFVEVNLGEFIQQLFSINNYKDSASQN
jgi:hypothetical protein